MHDNMQAIGRSDLPTTMRAAVYQKAGERMVVTDVSVPEAGQGEIVIKVVAASLCGSDLVCYRGYLGPKTEGIVGGHEAVGTVAAVHPSAAAVFNVGDRVGIMNCMGNCDYCKPCIAGHKQYCESGKQNQGFDVNGFFAEYAVVNAQFATKIPDSMPLERLAPLFCAGVTAFGALDKLDLPTRGTVGVFGLGGVGAFAVRFGVAMGYRIIGLDVSKAAMETAKSYGAEETIDLSNPELTVSMIKKITGGLGLDAAIVTAGVQGAFTGAIDHTGFNGTIVAVGIPAKPVEVNVLSLVKKRLRLQGTQSANPSELRQMMLMAERFKIIPDIELHAIENVPDLMEKLASGSATAKMGFQFTDREA